MKYYCLYLVRRGRLSFFVAHFGILQILLSLYRINAPNFLITQPLIFIIEYSFEILHNKKHL